MDTALAETVFARLNALALENPDLQEAALFYQHLIPVMNELSSQVTAITIDPLILRQKILTGTPMLVGERLKFDAAQARHIFITICGVVKDAFYEDPETAQVTVGQSARDILRAIDSGALDPLSLLTANGDNQPEAIEAAAARLSLDAPLLNLVAQNTRTVFLRSWRTTLESQVDLDEWRRAPCPFCGADAGLAEIQGVEAMRNLRCMRCGGSWPYSHLCCAFCGNEDHRTLGILLIDEQVEKPYLHTCDRCHRYIKTVVSFEPIPVDLLLVADLATLSLDSLAAESGFR